MNEPKQVWEYTEMGVVFPVVIEKEWTSGVDVNFLLRALSGKLIGRTFEVAVNAKYMTRRDNYISAMYCWEMRRMEEWTE